MRIEPFNDLQGLRQEWRYLCQYEKENDMNKQTPNNQWDVLETITQAQVDELKAANKGLPCVVHVYPRKRIVCVNGFRYYRLV